MLYVVRDLVKSKGMVLSIIFIIGVSYIGGISNRNINYSVNNNVNIVEEIN